MTFLPTAYALNAKKGYHDGDADTNYVAAPLVSRSSRGNAQGNSPGHNADGVVAFHPTGGGAKGMSVGDLAPGVGFGNGGQPAIAFSENQRAEVLETPIARQLTGGGKPGQVYPAVREGMGVRRLTPVECSRLQGLPDDWFSGVHPCPDSRMYSALGDAVTANVAEWIGCRLLAAGDGQP